MPVLSRLTIAGKSAGVLFILAMFVASLFVGNTSATAQRRGRSDVLATLSPQSQQIIERLSTFRDLPADTWRYHDGNIAHGRTSAWTTATGPW